jgi:hypothetical protein
VRIAQHSHGRARTRTAAGHGLLKHCDRHRGVRRSPDPLCAVCDEPCRRYGDNVRGGTWGAVCRRCAHRLEVEHVARCGYPGCKNIVDMTVSRNRGQHCAVHRYKRKAQGHSYRSGCRCPECRAAHAARMRRYRQQRRQQQRRRPSSRVAAQAA